MLRYERIGIFMTQFAIIRLVQEVRCSVMDAFFLFWNFFDTGTFYFLLIPLFWFGKDKKTGIKILIALLSLFCLVSVSKEYFAVLRPFVSDPSLAVITVSGYSFPSGAAASSMLLACLWIAYAKHKGKAVCALNYLFWMSLSRIYLGVHFPSDILGGWLLGLFVWGIFVTLTPSIERYLTKQPRSVGIVSGQLFCLLIGMGSGHMVRDASLAAGLLLSAAIPLWDPPASRSLKEAVFKGIGGLVATVIVCFFGKTVYSCTSSPTNLLVSYLTGFALGASGGFLCKAIAGRIRRKGNLR